MSASLSAWRNFGIIGLAGLSLVPGHEPSPRAETLPSAGHHRRLGLRELTLNAIARHVDIGRASIAEPIEGLFRASIGRDELFAFDGRVFRVDSETSNAEELARLRHERDELSKKGDAALAILEESSEWRHDVRLLRQNRDLRNLDMARMPPEIAERFEHVASLMQRHDETDAKAMSLGYRTKTFELKPLDGKKGEWLLIEQAGGGEAVDYTIYNFRGGEFRHYTRFTRSDGRESDFDAEDKVLELVEGGAGTFRHLRMAGDRARPLLLRALNGELDGETAKPVALRQNAAIALAEAHDARCVPLLMRIVSGMEKPADTIRLEEADRLLMGIRSAPEFLKALEDRSSPFHELALRHYAKFPNRETYPLLVESFERSEGRLKDLAAMALGRLGRADGLDHLCGLLSSREFAQEASLILAAHPRDEAVLALKSALARSPVRELVVPGASRCNDERLVPELCALARSEKPPVELWEALGRWATRGHPECVDALVLASVNRSASAELKQSCQLELSRLDAGQREKLIERAEGLRETLTGELRQDVEMFLRFRRLGIEFSERLPAEIREEILKNREAPAIDARPLAVTIYTKGDNVGAFFEAGNAFRDLIKQGYRVLYFEAESDREAIECLRGATHVRNKVQPADVLILGGHGTETSVIFQRPNQPLSDGRGTLDSADVALLKAAGVDKMVARGGVVILDACRNGEGGAEAENMANAAGLVWVDDIAIWSSRISFYGLKLHFDARGKVVRVEYGWGKDYSYRVGRMQ